MGHMLIGWVNRLLIPEPHFPAIIHPPRNPLALMIFLSCLLFPHLLFTEGLNFFLGPKTSFY